MSHAADNDRSTFPPEPDPASGQPLRRREFLRLIPGAALAARMACGTTSEAAAQTNAGSAEDPYVHYIRTSRDFQRVKQEKAWLWKSFPGWLYMPWTYQWTIGYTEASGQWSTAHGYNGSFFDGNSFDPDQPKGKLDWAHRHHLRFYLDHTAGKGLLHLWDGGKEKEHLAELHGNGVRVNPVNRALLDALKGRMKRNIDQVKGSPERAAYALDDEISWGHFVHPTMWRATDDPAAYPAWLKEVYGATAAPKREGWITYEELRGSLPDWTLRQFDASQLMDQWTFNDAIWANLVGELVEYANSLDPETPCGFVGGQAPNAFGGYDYARLMRKVQYIESYNIGGSQAIMRSFNPHNAIPCVTSVFHQSVEDDIWQAWYYLAHGNRGHIGWVENWFDGEKPKPWHDLVAPTYREAATRIGPLMQGAEWIHDGVALYYNHASVQLGWILDAQSHGHTWVNRTNDARLGSSHHVRKAWENMLRDSGIQYNWISDVDVLQTGIPKEYRVLILPGTLCLSDAEARAIEAFCLAGGTVIADYLPGLWDQHGRGRAAGGALDRLFGAKHRPDLGAKDLFGGKLWVEVDQDANYGWKTYTEFVSNGNGSIKDASGYHKAVREMPVQIETAAGKGHAVLMNLSPQWYNAYREQGAEQAKKRSVFMRHVLGASGPRWVAIENAGPEEFGFEITYFRKPDGRVLLYVSLNPEVTGSELGGGNSAGLKSGAREITLVFGGPVSDVRDERSGKSLGGGTRFKLTWVRNEAVVLSMAALPARRTAAG